MKADACSRCDVPLNENNWHPSAKKRRWLICKSCERIRQRVYYRDNPDKSHNKNRRNKYGLSYEAYQTLLENQNYVCAICGSKEFSKTKKNLSVDHDHITNKVRGLLCSECNTGLGKFKDSPDLLDKAKEYLNASKLY